VTSREPDDLASGKREPGGLRVVRLCVRSVPWSGVYRCGQCRWLQSSLRMSRPWPGCMGRSASGEAVRRGQSRGRPRRPGAAGQTDRRPRAWPLARRSCSCRPRWRLGHWRLACGQAADLAVAHAVVDQGQQAAGGRDLGDVAGFLAAAGDDGGLDRADH